MERLQVYMDGFRLNYEQFLVGCDALEQEGLWPVEELGEMDVYFANDLACIIIRLIAADGKFSDDEVAFLNESLGFNYRIEELQAVYAECGDKIAALFENELDESISKLKSVNPHLADTYKQMIIMLAHIVVESDGVVTESEKTVANQLLEVIQS